LIGYNITGLVKARQIPDKTGLGDGSGKDKDGVYGFLVPGRFTGIRGFAGVSGTAGRGSGPRTFKQRRADFAFASYFDKPGVEAYLNVRIGKHSFRQGFLRPEHAFTVNQDNVIGKPA
jgi:hypothetical protein